MNFSCYNFGYLEKGKIVEVQLSAAANITVAMSPEVHTESQFPQQATGILLLI